MSRGRVLALTTVLLCGVPASASGAVLTTGVLTTELGAPTAGQVRIYAFQLPSAKTGSTEMPHLGTAQAGTDGRFTVKATDEAQLARLAASRGGWIDLVAVADTPGRQAQWGFTAFVDEKARVLSADAVTRSGAVAAASKALPSPHIALEANRRAPFAQAAQGGTCDTKLRTRKPQSIRKLAIVGELNNAYNDGTRGTFTYGRSQTAETWFGAVTTVAGQVTPVISAEYLITNQGKAKFPTATKRYSRKLRSLFEFTKYQVQRSSCAVWETEIRATSWLSGSDSRMKQKGIDKCDPRQLARGWEGGSSFERKSGSAVRFTKAVEAFGVNLTSRSGFSRDITLEYSFGGSAKKAHYLCGPDGKQSPMEAGRVFSGARK